MGIKDGCRVGMNGGVDGSIEGMGWTMDLGS